MNGRGRLRTQAFLVGLAAVAMTGCSSSAAIATVPATATAVAPTAAPTPWIIYVTPEPTPWIIYVTPPPTSTPAVTAVPGATSRAAVCTGSAAMKAFIAEAVARLSFPVYCMILPAGWSIYSGEYKLPNGGQLYLEYRNRSGAYIRFYEGAFCTTSPDDCSHHFESFGAAWIDQMQGQMYRYDGSPSWVIYVAPGTSRAYQLVGHGMTPAQLHAWASMATIKVPRL